MTTKTRTTPEERAGKVDALQAQLAEQLEALTTSDDWRHYLDTAARFHTYSPRNVLAIMFQMPEATRVAGYRTWQAMGRQVRKGERGIAVLAPCAYTKEDEETGERRRVLRGFRVEHVFDVSQTDGDDLPDVRPALLTGTDPAGLWDALAAQVTAHGYRLELEARTGPHNGRTTFDQRLVTVTDDLAPAARCKTLAHELGHVMLHGPADVYGARRQLAEVEAESVAYVVMGAAGVDSAAYTLPYVARWAEGDPKKVAATATRVQQTARQILDALADDEHQADDDQAA